MVKIRIITNLIFYSLLFCAILSACDSTEIDFETSTNNRHEYLLNFSDTSISRSELQKDFSKGDKLYFYFNGVITSEATAIFGDDSKWHITLNKELKEGDSGICNVVYTEGEGLIPTEYNYYTINPGTALYGSQDGHWEYSNGAISVFAHLYPLQVKLKFVADSETDIMIKGIQPEDYFSVKLFSHWSYNDKYRPCYPQSIKINKEETDGKYVSDDYFCIGIGTGFYRSSQYIVNPGCSHYHYSNSDYITDPCSLDQVYIYDRNNISKCYRRTFPLDIAAGSSLIIKVPTPAAHEGWEMIDNQIQTITGERRGVYIETGITNTCGYSVNFSVKKDFSTNDDLDVRVGFDHIFRMIKPNNTWENFSAISFNERTDCEIVFVGKGGDANVSPFNYFSDITYSHFPFYKNELIESWDDY